MPAYAGAGKATLLNANTQKFLFGNSTSTKEPAVSGTASVAFQLERQKSAFYPWGWAAEFIFDAAPGTFEIDCQGAETDTDASYCNIGTAITAVNGSNVCRFDSGVTLFPRYVRFLLKTVTNVVNVTGRITR